MTTTTAATDNSSLLGSTNPQNVSQVATDCLNALRLFIGPGQITQIAAFEVRAQDASRPRDYAGYFDYDHLELMAREAARFSGSARGVYFTLNPLKADAFDRCPNRVQLARSGVLAGDKDVVGRTWLLIDFDPHRPARVSASDAEKLLAWNMLNCVSNFLRSSGFPEPIIGDSGNGYHLYFRIDLHCEDELPHRILKMLSDQFGSDEVSIDTSVAKASQLTKLFGTVSAKGSATFERPHRRSSLLSVPNLTTVDAGVLSRLLPPVQPRTSESTPGPTSRNAITRARSYLAAMPPSISGDRGHNRLLEAACRLVHGFGLSITKAFPLLLEYNERAVPPWNEEDLRRKLEQAEARPKTQPKGYLLNINTVSSSTVQHHPIGDLAQQLPGPLFPFAIPDFIPVPTTNVTRYLTMDSIELRRGRPKFDFYTYLTWLSLYGIFVQRIWPVVIPDALVAAGIVGASPKRRWRNRLIHQDGHKRLSIEAMRREIRSQKIQLNEPATLLETAMARDPLGLHESLVDTLERKVARIQDLEAQCPPVDCPEHCPLHASGSKHEHYLFRPKEDLLGPMTSLATETGDRAFEFDFDKKVEGESTTVLDSLVRSNQAQWGYLPVQLFGQAAGLSPRQIRLIQGLMRERTRTKSTNRQNAAKPSLVTIRNARVKAVLQNGDVTCPFLSRDEKYIVFGGNFKSRRGQGYQLVGRFDDDILRQGGWLRRLGYEVTSQMAQMDQERVWRWIGTMLADLAELSPSLGLVVGAIDKVGQWRSLDELRVMVGEARHRQWLKNCSLRIFAPADHLVQWRRWFAERLGFSFIPGGDWSLPEGVALAETNRPTAETIRARMKANRIKAKRLAEFLGWLPSRVSRQLSGQTALSDELIAAAHQLIPAVPTEPIASGFR